MSCEKCQTVSQNLILNIDNGTIAKLKCPCFNISDPLNRAFCEIMNCSQCIQDKTSFKEIINLHKRIYDSENGKLIFARHCLCFYQLIILESDRKDGGRRTSIKVLLISLFLKYFNMEEELLKVSKSICIDCDNDKADEPRSVKYMIKTIKELNYFFVQSEEMELFKKEFENLLYPPEIDLN